MKVYLSGFFYHNVWIDDTDEKVVGIFSDFEQAKAAAEKAVRLNEHGRPFVHEFELNQINDKIWGKKPFWLGEIYRKGAEA